MNTPRRGHPGPTLMTSPHQLKSMFMSTTPLNSTMSTSNTSSSCSSSPMREIQVNTSLNQHVFISPPTPSKSTSSQSGKGKHKVRVKASSTAMKQRKVDGMTSPSQLLHVDRMISPSEQTQATTSTKPIHTSSSSSSSISSSTSSILIPTLSTDSTRSTASNVSSSASLTLSSLGRNAVRPKKRYGTKRRMGSGCSPPMSCMTHRFLHHDSFTGRSSNGNIGVGSGGGAVNGVASASGTDGDNEKGLFVKNVSLDIEDEMMNVAKSPKSEASSSSRASHDDLNSMKRNLFSMGASSDLEVSTKSAQCDSSERSDDSCDGGGSQPMSAAQILFSDDGIAKAEPPSPSLWCLTPKSCPGYNNSKSQQLQTPLTSYSAKRTPAKTYQSPHWSEAVSVNPFSPVPPHHLHGASVCDSDDHQPIMTSPLAMDSSYCSPPTPSSSSPMTHTHSSLPKQQKGALHSPPRMPLSPSSNNAPFHLPPLKPRKTATTLPRLETAAMERHDLYCPSPTPPLRQNNHTHSHHQHHKATSLPQSMILQPPPKSRLETDFQILATIGKGSFGTVHKVLSRLDGCLYAIKVIQSSIGRGSSQRCSNAALKEVHALAALCNQSNVGTFHIVRYHQAFIDVDDLLYIQMELCERSLLEELKVEVVGVGQDGHIFGESAIHFGGAGQRKRMEDKRCWKLLREILLALDLIHHNNMVHLDIKPENIFIKEDMYKLGDFGLASALNSGTNDVEEGDARYMAKELLSDHASCDLTKCDIFSLGATLYEIVTCKSLPADGEEWQNLRNGTFSDSMNDIHFQSIPSDDSQFMEEQSIMTILKEMMHPDPSKRPSAADLLHRDQLLSQEQQELLKEKNKAKAKEASIALQIQNLKLSDSSVMRSKLKRRCSA